MILVESDIRSYIKSGKLVIDPISNNTIQCNGVDLRLGSQISRLRLSSEVFDTHKKNTFEGFYSKEVGSCFLIQPHERFLACTHERLELPNELVGFVNLRSTYTRLGLFSPCGFVEAGFKGQLTVEITGGSFAVKVYALDRLFHVIFMKLTGNSESIYMGKYQNQTGVTLPMLNHKAAQS